ncbi:MULTISPECIES: FliH/SctL family protein [unclassified Sphingomonas]|jgi:flagellar assembly protein FliH|uniref:FliH/SctL family protein n=1 Tax=unclassified Sphingomonas TaxID=196159 RepID=UPI0006F31DC3|nr:MULTISPECIES: FliH/SctL family protein [unclassified Sphingomonas]KQN28867.1 flagellar biosynthesis protein FliH [Sphingomonas sp. Leaf38]KQN31944.1 flagellar biosynthesis protein FliH [Sphingomonas sp. Leaf34]
MSNGFTAGFASRHTTTAHILAGAFAPPSGFAAADIRERASVRHTPNFAAPSFSTEPKHFSPADKDVNPTAGWDPLDPASESSFIDPLAAAHAAGFAEGLAAAALAAQETANRDGALLGDLATALGADRIDRERVAAQLRQTVLLLVSKLVGEVGIAPDILAGRIETAAELLADSAESALLRVHPDDVALLEGRLSKSIFAAGDPSVARGSFVLESASTIVEDGPELWIDQLAQAIDRVPVPR